MPAHARNLARIRSTRNSREFRQLLRRYPARTSIIAEGDSWFAYPPKGILFGRPSNVIAHLRRRERFNLLQLASTGDEAVSMLAGKNKFHLIKLLNRFPVDYLLFSGGGNDLVGRYDFDFFLRRRVSSQDWFDYLDHDRLDRRIEQIENAYADLLDFCASYAANPDIRVVTHTYDYVIPDPQGAEFLGGLFKLHAGKSWLHPFLRDARVPRRFDRPIVRHLIDRLADCLLDLADTNSGRLIVADTRGTLSPTRGWLNEIHPTSQGFGKIADVLYDAMQNEP